jgi:hypothetical protein
MTNLFEINTALPRWWWLNPWKTCLILHRRTVDFSNLSREKLREAMSYRHMAIEKDMKNFELQTQLNQAREAATVLNANKPAKRKRKTK